MITAFPHQVEIGDLLDLLFLLLWPVRFLRLAEIQDLGNGIQRIGEIAMRAGIDPKIIAQIETLQFGLHGGRARIVRRQSVQTWMFVQDEMNDRWQIGGRWWDCGFANFTHGSFAVLPDPCQTRHRCDQSGYGDERQHGPAAKGNHSGNGKPGGNWPWRICPGNIECRGDQNAFQQGA